MMLSIQRPSARPPSPDEFRISVEAVALLAAIVVVVIAGTVLAVWGHRRRLARRGQGTRR